MKLIIQELLADGIQQPKEPPGRKNGFRLWAAVIVLLYVFGLLLALLLKWYGPAAWQETLGTGTRLTRNAGVVAVWVELGAIVLIGIGILAAIYTVFILSMRTLKESHWMPSAKFPALFRQEEISGSLTLWLLLGLEFAIAADIIKTAVSPDWNEIGKLAAIVSIRAFLGYLLQIDLEKAAASKQKELPAEGKQQPITIKPAA